MWWTRSWSYWTMALGFLLSLSLIPTNSNAGELDGADATSASASVTTKGMFFDYITVKSGEVVLMDPAAIEKKEAGIEICSIDKVPADIANFTLFTGGKGNTQPSQAPSDKILTKEQELAIAEKAKQKLADLKKFVHFYGNCDKKLLTQEQYKARQDKKAQEAALARSMEHELDQTDATNARGGGGRGGWGGGGGRGGWGGGGGRGGWGGGGGRGGWGGGGGRGGWGGGGGRGWGGRGAWGWGGRGRGWYGGGWGYGGGGWGYGYGNWGWGGGYPYYGYSYYPGYAYGYGYYPYVQAYPYYANYGYAYPYWGGYSNCCSSGGVWYGGAGDVGVEYGWS